MDPFALISWTLQIERQFAAAPRHTHDEHAWIHGDARLARRPVLTRVRRFFASDTSRSVSPAALAPQS
jgi:hypothetical protein